MTDIYTFEVGNSDHKKNHAGRKLLAQGGKLMVSQLMHNKTAGDRIHVPVTIPAGDYMLVGGDIMDGGNFQVTLEPGTHS